jgi:predicted metalloenzyme YecM
LKPQKIKVASNLLVESRVITVDEPGSKFWYSGIVIVRRMINLFEFNFPITVAGRIVSVIEIIMKNNEK